MTDFIKGLFGYKNRKLEKMLSNDPTLNIQNFKNHYENYKPVMDQINKFDKKKDLIDIQESAEFAKKDLYNLVIDKSSPCTPEEKQKFIKEILRPSTEAEKKSFNNLVLNNVESCSPEERDIFINEIFGDAPLRPIPRSKQDLKDIMRLLDYLGVTPHESITSLRYHFDSPEEDSIIDDIASRHLNFYRIEHSNRLEKFSAAMYSLIKNLDYTFLEFLKENIIKYEDFMLISFEPYIVLSLGSTFFLAIFQSLHVRGTFKRVMLKIIAKREAEFGFFTKLKTFIVRKALRWINMCIGPRKFGLLSDKLCDYMFIWICQSSCVLSVFAYILFFR